MTKRKSTGTKSRDGKNRERTKEISAAKRQETEAASGGLWDYLPSQAAVRETVESIVIAFVLAFLFRTFEAEAFVIPTGSMAPTLMGRHKDVECPMCHYHYQVGASSEVDANSGVSKGPQEQIKSCTCPMCRYTMDVGPLNPRHEKYPSYPGDRILVAKFPYQFGDPKRWDVAVFKYPAEAKTNYIKRVIGLPGETVRVSHGDIFIRRPGQEEFRIARKPPKKLLAVLQPVYDDDYVLETILREGWPARWTAEGAPETWTPSADGRSFETDGASTSEPVWLRYRHVVPSYQDWQALEKGSLPRDTQHRPQLISDFTAYNTCSSRSGSGPSADALGLHWVGDLVVECTMEIRGNRGEAIFQLVEGGRLFQCTIDVATGEASLSIDGLETFRPTAQTRVRGPGTYRIRFANVDNELRLWVDGRVVEFDASACYRPLGNLRPTEADLSPVGIASRGASLRISHLKIMRDLYYIAAKYGEIQGNGGTITDYDLRSIAFFPNGPQSFIDFMSEPSRWKDLDLNTVEFPLEEDQFFMLGDNSARSKDSRLWGREHFVDRRLLTGKALFIYWPHSWHRIPYLNIPFPFFPNFARMHVIR